MDEKKSHVIAATEQRHRPIVSCVPHRVEFYDKIEVPTIHLSTLTIQLEYGHARHTFVHVGPSSPGTAMTPPFLIKSILELRQQTAQVAPLHRS